MKQYAEQGFQISGGDLWAERPELKLFAGSMLRPAIERTIETFQQREGVQVSTVYNGCGILVAQMKAGQVPDAYFACDTEFMKQVPDLFPEPVDVSQNELVILVQKGNPQNIGSLRDLTKPGLRVGIGHEKQCAMGWLTQNTFREGGVQTGSDGECHGTNTDRRYVGQPNADRFVGRGSGVLEQRGWIGRVAGRGTNRRIALQHCDTALRGQTRFTQRGNCGATVSADLFGTIASRFCSRRISLESTFRGRDRIEWEE